MSASIRKCLIKRRVGPVSVESIAEVARRIWRGCRAQLRELLDQLFGYDFFISYAHADGSNYALKTKQLLEQRRFRVCVDLNEFPAGDSIGELTRRRIRGSRRLIVICRPAALSSRYVHLEVKEFVSRKGRPLVIDVNGTLAIEQASWTRISLSHLPRHSPCLASIC
jgi:hypothetical protein